MNIQARPSWHWEQKAKQARDKAKTMISAEARRLMRDVARRYRYMATVASKHGVVTSSRISPMK